MAKGGVPDHRREPMPPARPGAVDYDGPKYKIVVNPVLTPLESVAAARDALLPRGLGGPNNDAMHYLCDAVEGALLGGGGGGVR